MPVIIPDSRIKREKLERLTLREPTVGIRVLFQDRTSCRPILVLVQPASSGDVQSVANRSSDRIRLGGLLSGRCGLVESQESESVTKEFPIMPNGADVLVEGLLRWGVRHLFGMPGSHSTTIYDALARSGSIRTILIRNEQAGAFAADGSARVTGEPGVVCTTAGPGATNALTGVAECWADSVPILLLAGQVNSDALDRECGNYHEIDLEGIFRPATAWCGTVRRPDRIPAMLGRAYQAMTWGRPRPAALFLPQDLMRATCEVSAEWPAFPPPPLPAVPDDAIAQAAEILAHAKRPLVLAGGGALWSGAAEAIEDLALRLGAPVITTLNGKGLLDERHPLSLGHARSVRAQRRAPTGRRHAGRRMPVYRGPHGLEADAGPRPSDPDRPRSRTDRHESSRGRGDRRRRRSRVPRTRRCAATNPAFRRLRLGDPLGRGPRRSTSPPRVVDRNTPHCLAP